MNDLILEYQRIVCRKVGNRWLWIVWKKIELL